MVELDRLRPGLVIEVATDAPVVGPQPVHEDAEIGKHLRRVAQPPSQPERVQAARRERLLKGVHKGNPELLGERPDVAMAAVDVLPTVLGGLLRVKEPADREAPASQPLLPLIEGGRNPVTAQPIGTSQATQAGTDDNHRRVPGGHGPGGSRHPERGHGERPRADQCPATADHLPAELGLKGSHDHERIVRRAARRVLVCACHPPKLPDDG